MTPEERREGWAAAQYVLGTILVAMIIVPVGAVVLGGMRVTIHPGIGDAGPPPRPPALNSTSTFLGERGGLHGWLVERPGEEPCTVYVSDDGHAVFRPLYAPDGTRLSERQIEAAPWGPPAPPSPAPLSPVRDRPDVPDMDTDAGEGGS